MPQALRELVYVYKSVGLMAFQCWSHGVSVLVSWCFSVGLMVFQCWSHGVSVLVSWCFSVGLMAFHDQLMLRSIWVPGEAHGQIVAAMQWWQKQTEISHVAK
jgi:hypothetical protein